VRILLASVVAAVLLLALAPAQSMAAIDPQTHIDNGTVQLGVVPAGNINAYDVDNLGDYFGLRYLQATGTIIGATNASPIVVTSAAHGLANGDVIHIAGVIGNSAANGGWVVANVTTDTFELVGSTGNGTYSSGGIWQKGNDATAVNFGCEGWGVADVGAAWSGYANLCDDPAPVHAEVESFTTTATTAVSTVLVRDSSNNPLLRVTHDYHPSAASDNIYEVTVTIQNVSAHSVDPRYRRVVNWVIEPNTDQEGLTISGKSSPYLLATSNDGYSSANPLSPTFCTGGPCVGPYLHGPPQYFFTVGKTDQGSLFDLALPSLAPSASLKFNLFYGAAGSKAAATSALTAVDADVWALATPSEGVSTGIPNTFTLAFRLADLVRR
jgi:hypothetical protein